MEATKRPVNGMLWALLISVPFVIGKNSCSWVEFRILELLDENVGVDKPKTCICPLEEFVEIFRVSELLVRQVEKQKTASVFKDHKQALISF
jgi:hypothetical protein